MAESGIDVYQYILEKIDSVPHLEAIILLWNSRPVGWTSEELASRLYLPPDKVTDLLYDLIRGCNPAPGAWTTADGKKLFVFNATKRIARTFSEVKGKKIGQVVGQTGGSLLIHGQGGFIEVHRVRWDGGKKIAAAEAGLEIGTILGG